MEGPSLQAIALRTLGDRIAAYIEREVFPKNPHLDMSDWYDKPNEYWFVDTLPYRRYLRFVIPIEPLSTLSATKAEIDLGDQGDLPWSDDPYASLEEVARRLHCHRDEMKRLERRGYWPFEMDTGGGVLARVMYALPTPTEESIQAVFLAFLTR